ncbi:MAG: LamG-like jellyroll fold domain-containing protein [Lysobacter sp.]
MIPGIVAGRAVAGGGGGGNDPDWANVLALLHFDGVDGSTTFTDEKGGVWTRNGAAHIDTAQSKFGGASARIVDSSSDFLISPSLSFEDEFRIEFWFYRETTDAMYVLARNGGASSAFFLHAASGTNDLRLRWGGVDRETVAGGATVGAWNYVVIEQDGVIAPRLYCNGIGGAATGGSATPFTDSLTFGANSNNSLRLTGWIDEIRLSNQALGTFTPPAAPFPNS